MGLAEKYPVRYTVEDWKQWQGDWELVEGVPYAMASPRPINQYSGYRIMTYFNNKVSNRQECTECYMLYETDWYVSYDTVVRPDLMVLCGEIPERVERPPELVVEIVSPSSRLQDERLKYELYEREGVRYFVLVYPEERLVKVYELIYGKYTEKQDMEFHFYECRIELNFSEALHEFG